MVDILHRLGIKASPDAVYKALTEREGLAAWWTNDTQGESKVGQALQFRFADSHGAEMGSFDMKVLDLEPAKRVQWQVVAGPDGLGADAGVAAEDDGLRVVVVVDEWRTEHEIGPVFQGHLQTGGARTERR